MQNLRSIEEKRDFYELFLTRFAHQMKTPLTVIQLLGDEFKNLPVSEANIATKKELVQSLAKEQDRLDANLNLILQTARLASFAFDVKMERIDLIDLLRSAVNEHKAAWIRQSVKEVCDRLGHRVKVVSKEGEGTTFTLGFDESSYFDPVLSW